MYKFRYGSNLNHFIHYGKTCFNHYTAEVAGGDAYNFWQKHKGGTTSKIKWLFESILRCYSYFKSFTELDFYALHPLDANCKDNSNDVVLTPKIKHWKKQKLDLNLRYDPAQNNANWGRKWNVDFNTGKTLLVLFQYSNICGVIDMKKDGSALDQKSPLRCWD